MHSLHLNATRDLSRTKSMTFSGIKNEYHLEINHDILETLKLIQWRDQSSVPLLLSNAFIIKSIKPNKPYSTIVNSSRL